MLLGYEEQSEDVKQSNSFWLGFVPVLAASILSGLAAALSQKALQGQKRGSYLFTSELAFFSILTMLANMLLTGDSLALDGFLDGWSWHALIPIVSQCSCCAHTRATHT